MADEYEKMKITLAEAVRRRICPYDDESQKNLGIPTCCAVDAIVTCVTRTEAARKQQKST
jgi:hypothetical protein